MVIDFLFWFWCYIGVNSSILSWRRELKRELNSPGGQHLENITIITCPITNLSLRGEAETRCDLLGLRSTIVLLSGLLSLFWTHRMLLVASVLLLCCCVCFFGGRLPTESCHRFLFVTVTAHSKTTRIVAHNIYIFVFHLFITRFQVQVSIPKVKNISTTTRVTI